ncbi:MAG TPA: cupin domain-containing protein [Chloroflexota bacterium]|nr:cupin domain-containing protein [Chloroflexota bacterium]
MHSRAAHLISSLALAPHPEGGYFREVYRSAARVQPLDARAGRAALTTIYFLLGAGEVSRWHRVASDEVWHYYEGDALELLTADSHFDRLTHHVLRPVGEGVQPVHVVPANAWQAARSTGAYTLVGCTVGPGFEFADFQLLRELPAEVEAMRQRHPEVALFV